MSVIFFDFDGTLVDTVPAFAAALRTAGAVDDDISISGGEIQQIVADAGSYGAVFDALSDEVSASDGEGPSISAAAIDDAFQEAYPTHGKLYPGVYRLLMALEDEAICGIVGSAPVPLLDAMVDYYGLDAYIAHTFSMAQQSPSLREALDTRINQGDLSPTDAYWASSRPMQLELARDLGVQTIYTAYGYGADPSVPSDHRVDRLSALFRLLS